MEKPQSEGSEPIDESAFAQEDRRLFADIERAAKALETSKPEVAGVQDVPPALVTGKVVALDELDLLRYTVLVERAQKLQLLVDKRKAELMQTSSVAKRNSDELGALLDTFSVKYGVDFHNYGIAEDGKILPIPR